MSVNERPRASTSSCPVQPLVGEQARERILARAGCGVRERRLRHGTKLSALEVAALRRRLLGHRQAELDRGDGRQVEVVLKDGLWICRP